MERVNVCPFDEVICDWPNLQVSAEIIDVKSLLTIITGYIVGYYSFTSNIIAIQSVIPVSSIAAE